MPLASNNPVYNNSAIVLFAKPKYYKMTQIARKILGYRPKYWS